MNAEGFSLLAKLTLKTIKQNKGMDLDGGGGGSSGGGGGNPSNKRSHRRLSEDGELRPAWRGVVGVAATAAGPGVSAQRWRLLLATSGWTRWAPAWSQGEKLVLDAEAVLCKDTVPLNIYCIKNYKM